MHLDSTNRDLNRVVAFYASRYTIGARIRQHTRARASPQTVKQSAATQRSVTADRELLQSYCLLLLDHGTADYVAAGGVGINILKFVSASADHEVAATDPSKSHGASAVRIDGIGAGEIQIPIIAGYKAATEVEDQTSRDAACAIERPQARPVKWPIGAYWHGSGWSPGAYWKEGPRKSRHNCR